jgi:hypothetical protein
MKRDPVLDGAATREEKLRYQHIVGVLLHVSRHTRPDIAFAVNAASRFSANPGDDHFAAAYRILQYLAGTSDMCLVMDGSAGLKPRIWADASLSNDPNDRSSTSGILLKMGRSIVAWKSSKQKVIANHAMEAEYVALSHACAHLLGLLHAAHEAEIILPQATAMLIDNESSKAVAENPRDHQRTMHIDRRHHFIRRCIDNGHVVLTIVRSAANVADILTKGLQGSIFKAHRAAMGVFTVKE